MSNTKQFKFYQHAFVLHVILSLMNHETSCYNAHIKILAHSDKLGVFSIEF